MAVRARSSDLGTDRGSPADAAAQAAHYREYAAQIRELADAEPDPRLRQRFVNLARQYEAEAGKLDPRPPRS